MTEINHERCSELLGGHVRGELGPEDSAAVERHLAGCDDCRAELAGMRALSARDDFEPLREEERRRLRDAVAQEARLAPARVYELSARRSFWERHAGQIVGAAASIVVLLFAALVVWGTFPSGDDAGDSGGGDGGDDSAGTAEQAPLDADAGAEGPRPVFVTPELLTNEEAATADEEAEQESARTLSPFEQRRSYNRSAITRLGQSGEVFRAFMEAYDQEDAAALAEGFLNQLASEVPDDDVGDRLQTCGKKLLDDNPERPLLPAFATVAEFQGTESLILGLVTSDGLTPELGRYSIWAWPLPVDDCDAILIGTSGDIGP